MRNPEISRGGEPEPSLTPREIRLQGIFAEILRAAGLPLYVSRRISSIAGEVHLVQLRQSQGHNPDMSVEEQVPGVDLNEAVSMLEQDSEFMERARIGFDQVKRGDVISLEVFERRDDIPKLKVAE